MPINLGNSKNDAKAQQIYNALKDRSAWEALTNAQRWEAMRWVLLRVMRNFFKDKL